MNKSYCPEERFKYLRSLITEYQETTKQDVKEQVLANLSNFAYDPKNYEHLRKLNGINLFLAQLDSNSEKLVEFAIGGICNAITDPENVSIVLAEGGLSKIIRCLSSQTEETLLSTLTSMITLTSPSTKSELTTPIVIERVIILSKNPSVRIRNLANIFLEDCCSPKQIQEATVNTSNAK